MESELLAMLKDWLAWVESGAGKSSYHTKRTGLCYSADVMFSYSLSKYLHELFRYEYYPFGGFEQYVYDSRRYGGKGGMHLNTKRLEWVRNKIKELEEKGVQPPQEKSLWDKLLEFFQK